MNNDTEAAVPAKKPPTFLENLGGEILDFVVAEAPNIKPGIVSFLQTEVQKGDEAVDVLVLKAFKANIPLVGSAFGEKITAIVDSADATLKADIPAFFDHIISELSAEAKSLES